MEKVQRKRTWVSKSGSGGVDVRELVTQTIIDKVPVMVVVYNIKTGEYVFINKAIKKILGYNPSDFINGGFPFVSSLVHPEDMARIAKENQEALMEANKVNFSANRTPDQESIINFEYRMKHKDGTYRWLHTDGSVFSRGSDGKVEYVLNASLDITHRKETEQKLASLSLELDEQVKIKTKELLRMKEEIQISERRYRTMVEQSPLSTQILSPNGKTLGVNKSWEVLWGAKLEQLKNYNMLEDKQLEELGIMPYIKRGFNGKATHIPAVKYEPKKTIPIETNVGFRWVKAIIYPVKDERGKILEVILVHEDITERKQAEQRKEDFVAVASHELKTPLTSVQIFVKLLKQHFEKNQDKKALDYLTKMEKQTNKLTDLVGDLLNLKRIETGRFEFKKKNFKMDELIMEVVKNLQGSNIKHKIIKIGKSSTKVYGDRDRIGQVLINLLVNAIKYSPDAKKINVFLKENNNEVTVSIQDFGIGIAKANQEKIFERFFRAEGENEKTFPGFGIGLYVSAEIIKRHNGKIWVVSEKGKGSTFHFSLPLETRRR